MVAPAVGVVGGLVARGGGMAGARALVARLLGGATPEATTATANVARATGVRGGVSKIVEAMKNNKLMTVLTLAQIGGAAWDYLSSMMEEDKEIAEIVERYGFKVDAVPEDFAENTASMIEEFSMISKAARIVGSYENLHTLRLVFSKLTEEHFVAYDQTKALAAAIR